MNLEEPQSAPLLPIVQPTLPPLEQYIELLHGIWQRGQLTNHGPLVTQLEQQLASLLEIERAVLVSNGALGLHLAIRALNLQGEVITTPFSYVATTACLIWEHVTPVFADIDHSTLTIDPQAVEAAITPRTEAILATHVYGNPCDVEALQRIAERHGLAIIYDAAHAFAVRFRGRSILDYGDLSMVSLHATKLFHTAEGGLVAGPNQSALEIVEWMRRFGHDGEEAFHGLGTNAKLSELHAALGLCQVPMLPATIEKRREACQWYDELLDFERLQLTRPVIREGTEHNHAYYPVLFASEQALLDGRARLQGANIYPRRYFYPSLESVFKTGRPADVPISRDCAARVLCLPLSTRMTRGDVQRVVAALMDA